jgi:hypothetical protein
VASLGLDVHEPGGPGTRQRLVRLAARLTALRDDRHVGVARAAAVELRPAWWAARGWLVVAALAWHGGDRTPLLLPDVDGPVLGLLLAIAATALSVRLGRRRRAAGGGAALTWDRIATIVGVVGTLVVLGALHEGPGLRELVVSGVGTYDDGSGAVVRSDGSALTNLFVYDRDGHLLDDVLVYDQDGRPVKTSSDGWDPDTGDQLDISVPVDANGAAVEHAYPHDVERITYGRNGLPTTEPVPPPAVVVPRLGSGTTPAPGSVGLYDGEGPPTTAPPITPATMLAPSATPAATPTTAATTTVEPATTDVTTTTTVAPPPS